MTRNLDTFKENKVLSSIAILGVLSIAGEMTITKCLLIEPMLSYKKVRTTLKRKGAKIRSIEELIIKEKNQFININERFLDKLVLSVNSIFLLKELGLIDIEEELIIFRGSDFNFDEPNLGKFAKDIINASFKLAEILIREEESKLYLNLLIEL